MRWGRAVAIAVGLTAALAGEASAEREYRVTIESEPDGAKVFIDDPDGESVGQTPYEGELEPGNYTIILERDGYETAIEALTVKKSRRAQKLRVDLIKKPTAYVKLRPADVGDDFEDSTILIDDIERTVEVDEKLELGVGAHKLEVVRDGFETYEAYFELEEGQLQAITVNFVPAGSKPKKGNGDGPIELKKGKEGSTGPSEPSTVRLFTLWGGFEWGGRDFKYDVVDPMLLEYNFLGVRFRLGGVVHPLRSYGKWLGGLGIGAQAAFLVGPRTSTSDNGTPNDVSDDLNASNNWFDYRLDLRYRLDFADRFWAGAAVGYGQDKFSFSNVDAALAGNLAAVDYKSLSFGVFGGARVGKATHIDAGIRLYQVSQAGSVQTRFTTATIAAFGLYVGGSIPVYGRLELAARLFYDRYAYAFGEPPPGATYMANSAIDQFFGFAVGAGFRY